MPWGAPGPDCAQRDGEGGWLIETTTGIKTKVTGADKGVEKQAHTQLVGMHHGAHTLGEV